MLPRSSLYLLCHGHSNFKKNIRDQISCLKVIKNRLIKHKTVTFESRLNIKVAEHSFRARFCWCNSARAQGLRKTSMPSIERSFYLLNTRTICAIFLYNWTQCIDGFSLLLQRYVRKGNEAKNPAILSFFFVTERTQLNTAHA